MTNIQLERSLEQNLQAYLKDFNIPNNATDLYAIASWIVTFQQKQNIISIAPQEIESLIQTVLDNFKVDNILSSVTDEATEKFVRELDQWRHSLETQTLDTILALKQILPHQVLDLEKTVLAIIPLIEDIQLRKVEVASLIKWISIFDLNAVLQKVVGTDAVAIAQKVANLLQFGDLETQLLQGVLGGQPLLNSTLATVTLTLIQQELAKIIGNDNLQFNITLDEQQMMVKQVSFKFNLMQASPPPTKTIQDINNQLDAEIARFKLARQTNP